MVANYTIKSRIPSLTGMRRAGEPGGCPESSVKIIRTFDFRCGALGEKLCNRGIVFRGVGKRLLHQP
jgi:hypothetical protein